MPLTLAALAALSVFIGGQPDGIPGGIPTDPAPTALPATSAPTPAPTPAPTRFVHVRIPGDLDHSAIVGGVEAALVKAGAAGHGVVFDVGGNRSRTDVLSSLCLVLRDSPVYSVVFLADNSDRKVGVGQLMLGLFADRCAIDPETRVVGTGSDVAFRELAADEPSWDIIEGELVERVAAQLEPFTASRTVAEQIASNLMKPASGFAIAKHGDRCTVVASDASSAMEWSLPPNPRAAQSETTIHATPRLLRLIGIDSAASVRNALSKMDGALVGGAKAVNLDETVDSVTVKLVSILADAETIEKDVDERLDMPDPALRTVARGQYLAAAQEGRHNLGEVERMIAEIEAMMERVPEVLRTPAPGQVAAGAKPASFAAKWRARVQKVRTRHDALLVRVEAFEKVP